MDITEDALADPRLGCLERLRVARCLVQRDSTSEKTLVWLNIWMPDDGSGYCLRSRWLIWLPLLNDRNLTESHDTPRLLSTL